MSKILCTIETERVRVDLLQRLLFWKPQPIRLTLTQVVTRDGVPLVQTAICYVGEGLIIYDQG